MANLEACVLRSITCRCEVLLGMRESSEVGRAISVTPCLVKLLHLVAMQPRVLGVVYQYFKSALSAYASCSISPVLSAPFLEAPWSGCMVRTSSPPVALLWAMILS